MNRKVELLLECRDLVTVKVSFIPQVGETHYCKKHGEQKIIKVLSPYWVEDKEKEIKEP